MLEAHVHVGPKVTLHEVPIPTAGPGQVVTKVIVSGSNPKDWKASVFLENAAGNQGDDICGTVHEVGDGVTEFKPGDRVAAFHQMHSPGGSFAEYALSWVHTTFHLPAEVSFEQGATLPLAAMTAAIGLFAKHTLALPQPWTPAHKPIPLAVWGAGTAVGSYVIQLAKKANIHPLICIAGRAQEHVERLIEPSKGDTIIDYRQKSDAISAAIVKALSGSELYHAYDCISMHGSYQNICEVLAPGAHITLVHPKETYPEIPASINKSKTYVADVNNKLKDFGYVYFRYFTRALEEGDLVPHPHELVPGGLDGIADGLSKLQSGANSAVKYVFRIPDTPQLKGIALPNGKH